MLCARLCVCVNVQCNVADRFQNPFSLIFIFSPCSRSTLHLTAILYLCYVSMYSSFQLELKCIAYHLSSYGWTKIAISYSVESIQLMHPTLPCAFISHSEKLCCVLIPRNVVLFCPVSQRFSSVVENLIEISEICHPIMIKWQIKCHQKNVNIIFYPPLAPFCHLLISSNLVVFVCTVNQKGAVEKCE